MLDRSWCGSRCRGFRSCGHGSSQRERGFVTEVQAKLRNTAAAMESYAVITGEYTGATIGALQQEVLW
jgi:hypothetical protein